MRSVVARFAAFAILSGAATACPTAALAADPPPAPKVQAQTQAPAADDDLEPQQAQPDFSIIDLPTNLRLPSHKLAFRVTHRFTRSLNQGDFGSSLADAFGLDSGAQIGLELRFSPFRGAQVGVYRTNDKTVDFFGEYSVLQQGDTVPVSVSAIGAVEGTRNFKDVYSPSIGAVIGRTIVDRAAFYVVPTWVNDTNPATGDPGGNSTFFVGLGARVQLVRTLYLVAEASPRAAGFKGGTNPGTAGYRPGRTLAAFAIEKQVGGHVFQINFSNAFATTPANIARGAAPGKTNWYLGFNISRKFY